MLEQLFGIVSHGAFNVIAGLVGIVLAVAGVNKLVLISLASAWFISILWIARSAPMQRLTIASRFLVVIFCALVLGFMANSFGKWALASYSAQQSKEVAKGGVPTITSGQIQEAVKHALAESGRVRPSLSRAEPTPRDLSPTEPVGFLQLESMGTQVVTFVPDRQLRVVGEFANRGQAPVEDARGFALLLFAAGIPKAVKDGPINNSFLLTMKKLWPTFKDKTQVGVDESLFFPTSTNDPITQRQMNNVVDGVDRIYLLSYAKWKTAYGYKEWKACTRLEASQMDTAANNYHFAWRVCDLD